MRKLISEIFRKDGEYPHGMTRTRWILEHCFVAVLIGTAIVGFVREALIFWAHQF